MNESFTEIAKVFKAFDDKKRLFILEFLRNGEKCGCDILEQLNISQSTLSHHMKILVESGIVDSRKDGKWTYYSISHFGAEQAKKLIDEITVTALIAN